MRSEQAEFPHCKFHLQQFPVPCIPWSVLILNLNQSVCGWSGTFRNTIFQSNCFVFSFVRTHIALKGQTEGIASLWVFAGGVTVASIYFGFFGFFYLKSGRKTLWYNSKFISSQSQIRKTFQRIKGQRTDICFTKFISF